MYASKRFPALFCFLTAAALTLTMTLTLPGNALAGGSSSPKKCGETIPSGSYKKHCKDIHWSVPFGMEDQATLHMKCTYDNEHYGSRMLACSQVKDCGFKLAFINKYPRCE